MSDQAAAPVQSELCTEIGASLASIWARYAGARPAGAKVEFSDGVVRWTLPDGNAELEKGFVEGSEEGPTRTAIGYKRETSAAVSKVTHRRVDAKISKQDKKTGVVTESFILEPPFMKN